MKIDVEKVIKGLSSKASALLNDKEKLGGVLLKAKELIKNNKELQDLLHDIKILIELVRDYKNGIYREIPNSSIVLVLISLIYLVNPMDLIPDFIIGGFIDDAAVIAFILKRISTELNAYKEWKSKDIYTMNDNNNDNYDNNNFNDDNMIEISLDDPDVEEF